MKLIWTIQVYKRKRRFEVALSTLCVLLVVFAVIAGICAVSLKTKEPQDLPELPRTIAHACGAIEDNYYTNSRDAFEYNYALGQRAFEVDFLLGSDGSLLCRHYWDDGIQEGFDSEHVPNQEEFETALILNQYASMTIYDIIDLLEKYPDIYMITDTKYTEPELIRQEFMDVKKAVEEKKASRVMNRFIVQLYYDAMLDIVNEVIPLDNYIYTLYQDWDGDLESFPTYCSFCNTHNIEYITMRYEYATKDVINTANQYGIKIYVHTVNDEALAQDLIDRGAYGVYTDELLFEDLEVEE